MTANSNFVKSLFSGNRLLVWVLAFFGVALVAMGIVWLVRKSKQGSTATDNPALPGSGTPQFPPYKPTPPTSTPPYIPTNNPNNGNSGNTDVYNVNWAYVQELSWKMYDTYFDRNSYKCELTNGIVEMGDTDLRALKENYRQWYSRNLANDYCQKIKSSGCWTAFWDDKPAKACNRLNSLN